MSNITKLTALKALYGVGNMEIADLIGYSYDAVNSWFRKRPTRLRDSVLRDIKSQLKRKYPKVKYPATK